MNNSKDCLNRILSLVPRVTKTLILKFLLYVPQDLVTIKDFIRLDKITR